MATQVSVERLYEIFDEPEPVRDRPGARPLHSPRGALEFRDVRFSYGRTAGDDDDPRPAINVLDGVNLKIEPGMRVGVLGKSGSGKSTLVALAPWLYDLPEGTGPDGAGSGSVRFDGVDVRELRLVDLRRAVALVPQQAMLFEGTIRTNLLYANPAATTAQMRQALEIADFAASVDALPLGLETHVGERGILAFRWSAPAAGPGPGDHHRSGGAAAG